MRHEGGYAFPVPEYSPGMTLRDWFAGQALAGYLAAYAHPQAIDTPMPLKAARCTYEYADAMLAAREEVAS